LLDQKQKIFVAVFGQILFVVLLYFINYGKNGENHDLLKNIPDIIVLLLFQFGNIKDHNEFFKFIQGRFDRYIKTEKQWL